MSQSTPNEIATGNEKVSLIIHLNEDHSDELQLGSRTKYQNRTRESQYSPRELVTEKESFRGNFYIQIKSRDLVFGKFTRGGEVVPACRIVLDAAFASTLTTRKYKMAKIMVSFEDSVITDLDPDDDENEAVIEDALQFQPKVLAFEPRQWYGHEDVRDGEMNIEGNLNIAPPGLGPSLDLGFKRTRPIILTGRTEIEGVIRGETSSVIQLGLKQNMIRNSGIIPQFSIPIVVQYTPGRTFAARVRVAAEVEWRLSTIASGKLDDPLRFDPDKLYASEADLELNTDLRPFCHLEEYDGEFN